VLGSCTLTLTAFGRSLIAWLQALAMILRAELGLKLVLVPYQLIFRPTVESVTCGAGFARVIELRTETAIFFFQNSTFEKFIFRKIFLISKTTK
jgi:hypothetical protein